MKNNNIKFETKTGGFILGREPKPKKGTLGYAWEKENKYRNVKIKPLLDNNAWIDRFDRKFKDEEFGPANYTHYFNESRIYQQIKSFIQTEIDRAVEDKILEFSKIIDRNTVDGMYSPDGIAQDLITFIGAEAIKKHLSINKKETK